MPGTQLILGESISQSIDEDKKIKDTSFSAGWGARSNEQDRGEVGMGRTQACLLRTNRISLGR